MLFRSMYSNLYRDEQLMPTVAVEFAGFRAYLEQVARALAHGRPRRKAVAAALRHAVDFTTWRSLARDGGLSRAQAVRLMVALVDAG